MENAVEIKDVSMRFNLSKERVDNIKEWVVRKLKGKGVSFDEFWALKDISLTIPKGDFP